MGKWIFFRGEGDVKEKGHLKKESANNYGCYPNEFIIMLKGEMDFLY